MAEDLIGEVTHYFSRVGVAVLKIETPLRKGDWIRFTGHTTDLLMQVESMEIQHERIEEAISSAVLGPILSIIRRTRCQLMLSRGFASTFK